MTRRARVPTCNIKIICDIYSPCVRNIFGTPAFHQKILGNCLNRWEKSIICSLKIPKSFFSFRERLREGNKAGLYIGSKFPKNSLNISKIIIPQEPRNFRDFQGIFQGFFQGFLGVTKEFQKLYHSSVFSVQFQQLQQFKFLA